MSDGSTARTIEEFRSYRQRMNARIHEANHLGIKRFFALDSAAYRGGALPGCTKVWGHPPESS